MDAALDIRRRQAFAAADIQAITIYMGPGEYKLLGTPIEAKRAPRSNVQAQFSNPWIVATTLLDGRLSLADFSPAALDRAEVLALTARTHTVLDASLLAEGGGVGPTRLTVELRDGRRLTQTVHTAKGEPRRPLSTAEFEQKFFDCARSAGLAESQAAALLASILGLERLTDARELTQKMIPA